MKQILAVDPGTTESAFVLYDPEKQNIDWFGTFGNDGPMFHLLWTYSEERTLIIENIGHYGTGMPAGKEVFHTCFWIGRFIQSWIDNDGLFDMDIHLIKRPTVKTHLCGKASGKDANVSQALRDRFGEKKTKANPDGFFPAIGSGWTAHNYQALALAVYFSDIQAVRNAA